MQVQGSTDKTGRIGSVKATGGGITSAAIEAEGRMGSLWSRGSITGDVTANSGGITPGIGLGTVFATGNMTASINVTGGLGRVTVRGSLLDSTVDVTSSILTSGDWGLLSVLGDVTGSRFEVEGLFRTANVGGNFANSNTDAGKLRKVLVKGQISEDAGDGEDEIRAHSGRFFARDVDESDWIDSTHEHDFDGLRAWVG